MLAWADVLHEGPVRGGLGPGALAAERAAFLAARFGLDPDEPRRRLAERDAALAAALARGDELVLWFEHDLFDQLQLLQVLDRLPATAPARLAQADGHLHRLEPAALAALGASAPPATPAQHALAREAWAAFASPTPEPLGHLLAKGDLAPLPWLRPALARLLEELPAPGTGLSRTERLALEALAVGGRTPPGELFRRVQARDEPWFMGDWPFFLALDGLAAEPSPLVAGLPASGYPCQGPEADRRAYLAAEVLLTPPAPPRSPAASTAPPRSRPTVGSAAPASPPAPSGAGTPPPAAWNTTPPRPVRPRGKPEA